jgi:hypothetical protein
VRRSTTLGLVVVATVLTGCGLLPAPFRPLVTRDEAIAIARQASVGSVFEGAEVLDVRQLTYGEVANERAPVVEGDRPAPADCVWFVNLGEDPGPLMGGGVMVVIDCDTANVVHVTQWMT